MKREMPFIGGRLIVNWRKKKIISFCFFSEVEPGDFDLKVVVVTMGYMTKWNIKKNDKWKELFKRVQTLNKVTESRSFINRMVKKIFFQTYGNFF